MAHAVELTICTGNKVSLNYQSQEVSVSLTYQLERKDNDVLAIVEEKSVEVSEAHALAWKVVKGKKPEPPVLTPGESESSKPELQSSASTTSQQAALRALLSRTEWSEETLQQQLSIRYGCTQLEQLSERQAAGFLLELQRNERQKVQAKVQIPFSRNGQSS